jgi:GcrA cell cycle regulator
MAAVLMPAGRDREWPEERVLALRAAWDEGLSTAAIGRRIGVSKSAVNAKADRLGLPGRESPIRRRTEPKRVKPLRPGASTLPPLASEEHTDA